MARKVINSGMKVGLTEETTSKSDQLQIHTRKRTQTATVRFSGMTAAVCYRIWQQKRSPIASRLFLQQGFDAQWNAQALPPWRNQEGTEEGAGCILPYLGCQLTGLDSATSLQLLHTAGSSQHVEAHPSGSGLT